MTQWFPAAAHRSLRVWVKCVGKMSHHSRCDSHWEFNFKLNSRRSQVLAGSSLQQTPVSGKFHFACTTNRLVLVASHRHNRQQLTTWRHSSFDSDLPNYFPADITVAVRDICCPNATCGVPLGCPGWLTQEAGPIRRYLDGLHSRCLNISVPKVSSVTF